MTALWDKIKAACLRSLTIAWGYIMMAAGALLAIIDTLGDALGDPTLKDQIAAAVGDTKTAARVLAVAGIVTIIARMRSLWKAARS